MSTVLSPPRTVALVLSLLILHKLIGPEEVIIQVEGMEDVYQEFHQEVGLEFQ